MNISMRVKIISALVLVVFGVASRFIPHAWNITPLTAIALFSASYLGMRYSLLVMIGIMFMSDLFLGFYQWQVMVAVYGSFVVAGIIGIFINRQKIQEIFVGTIGASLSFFLVTNWAVWQYGTMYPHSLFGLFQSYLMAIPFFRNSLAGDLFYTGLLFGTVFALDAYLKRKRVAQHI